MDFNKCKEINICELCNVERAVKGKIYKAGTCFIKLSAVDDFVGQIVEGGEIDSRFAVFEPKKEVNVAYIHIAVSRAFPEFLRRYRTTINLQFDTLKHFKIIWHDDLSQQQCIVEKIRAIDEMILFEKQQLEVEKTIKKYYLNKMLV